MPRRVPAPQPHDGLFKYAFSQREHAVGLLKALLPPEVSAALTWDSLALEKGSFVDRALRNRHTDLLFSVRLGAGKVYLYTLVEQQRGVEPLMIFRGGVYMMRAWEHLVRDRPSLRRLPPMMLIVIHHSDTGWTAPTAFEELIEVEGPARAALLPYTPRFQMKLVDLSPGRASDLAEQALTSLGQVVLWCLSVAGDDARLVREIGRIGKALDAVLASSDAVGALTALLRYLLTTHASMGAPKIVRLVEKAASAGQKEVVVDVLDVFRQEGREEGRVEGRAEGERQGRAKTLLELLAARFGTVPADVRARILEAKETTLSRWSLRVLTAPSLAAVLDAKDKGAAPRRRTAARKRTRAS